MAKANPRKVAGAGTADIDWYLISIDRLKKIGLVLLIILLGAGAYFYWDYRAKNPRQKAQRAISAAQAAMNQLAASSDFNTFRTDFDRATVRLEEARALLTKQQYAMSETAANEAQTVVTAALARIPGERDSDAQFLSVEGDVQFQKGGSSDWKRAEMRAPLFNGDWVKTGGGASAELIFSNGSLYTVGPNALLEIYSVLNPATSKKQNSVQMQIGLVEINTSDDASTVRTPGTQIVVNSLSTAQVGVDASTRSTQVVNLRGSAAVGGIAGKPAATLSAGEQIAATREGELSQVSKVIMPPPLITPADNQVFQASADRRVAFTWGVRPEATGYQLQVSRSRLFSRNEIDARRLETRATGRVTSDGSFFWRVASIDLDGRRGPFSPFRRFRVSGLTAGTMPAGSADKTPPTLEMKRPFSLGGATFQFEGKVEPGATVFINDQEIDVGTDGTFRKLITFERYGWNTVVVKAVDAAGNQTVQQDRVHIEQY